MESVTEVVFLANDVDRLGGISKFMSVLGSGFRSRGLEVTLIGIEPSREFQSYAKAEGVKSITLYSELPKERLPNPKNDLTVDQENARRVRHRMELRTAAVNQLRDIALGWTAQTAIISTQLFAMEHLIETGIPFGIDGGPMLFGQYHGAYKAAEGRGDVVRALRAYPLADRTLALTEYDAQKFTAAGLTNVSWMPNPIDVDPKFALPEREKVVVSLARYHEEKSLHLLIQAWAQIAPEFPDWKLELYGEGDERAFLQETIDENGLGSQVFLMGMTDQVYEVLGRSSLHALSSQSEGLPLAIAEANALGTPTVAFNCSAGVEVMTDYGRAGVLAEPNNVTDLARALRSVLGSDEFRIELSKAAVESAKAYLVNNILDAWQAEFLRARL